LSQLNSTGHASAAIIPVLTFLIIFDFLANENHVAGIFAAMPILNLSKLNQIRKRNFRLAAYSLLVLGCFVFKSVLVTYYFSNLSSFAMSYVIGSEEEEESSNHFSFDVLHSGTDMQNEYFGCFATEKASTFFFPDVRYLFYRKGIHIPPPESVIA